MKITTAFPSFTHHSTVRFGWTKHTKLNNTLDCSKPGRHADKTELQQLLNTSGRYPHPDLAQPGGLVERIINQLDGDAGFYVIRHVEALVDVTDEQSQEKLTKHLARLIHRYHTGKWPAENKFSTFENGATPTEADKNLPFFSMVGERFEGPSTTLPPHYDYLWDADKNGLHDYFVTLYSAPKMTNIKKGSAQFQVIDLSQKYRDQRQRDWRGNFARVIKQAQNWNDPTHSHHLLERYTKTIPYDAENEVMIAIVNNRGATVEHLKQRLTPVTEKTVGVAHTGTQAYPRDPDQPMKRELYHATVRLYPPNTK